MNLRHVEEVNHLSEVLDQFYVLSPIASEASQIIYEHHQSLQQVRVDNLSLVLGGHVYRWELGRIIVIIIIKGNTHVSVLLGEALLLGDFDG